MYLYSDPVYPRTTLEKVFKQIHSITNALIFATLVITIVDFYVRVDNTFVNYWGGSGGISMGIDVSRILDNCTFDWELDITTTTVDVHISDDSALIVGVITAAFIVGVCVLTFILMILDTVVKTFFLINVRHVRFRGVLFPIQTVFISSVLVVSIGIIGAISASDGSLRFMDRYVQKCSSEFNDKQNAANGISTGGDAFIEAELDSATVFGTNLYLILAAVSLNLLGFVIAAVTRVVVSLNKSEGRLLAARMPYLKPGPLCVPDKLLLREYGVQRKLKIRELDENPFATGTFQPVLSGDVLVDEGDNDLTMAALLYDWTRDPKVDSALLAMTEKEIREHSQFTEVEKTKLVAERKALVEYVRQRQKEAIKEIKRQDKEKRMNQAANALRRKMNAAERPELFQEGNAAANINNTGGDPQQEPRRTSMDVESPDSLGNSLQNAPGQPWNAEELDTVDPLGETAQELNSGDADADDVSPVEEDEEGEGGVDRPAVGTPRSDQESVSGEAMDDIDPVQAITEEDEYSQRREKKSKKDKSKKHRRSEEDHLNVDIPILDDDDDEPYYVYYDEDGNLLGEGSEFDALGEEVDTLEEALKGRRDDSRERKAKKDKKKSKKEKKEKRDKKKGEEMVGAPSGLFAPPFDADDSDFEAPQAPPGYGPADSDEDAVPAPPPNAPNVFEMSPPPRQVRPSPDFETAIPIAPTP